MADIVKSKIEKLQSELPAFYNSIKLLNKRIWEYNNKDLNAIDENGITNESKLIFLEMKFIESRSMINRIGNTVHELKEILEEMEKGNTEFTFDFDLNEY